MPGRRPRRRVGASPVRRDSARARCGQARSGRLVGRSSSNRCRNSLDPHRPRSNPRRRRQRRHRGSPSRYRHEPDLRHVRRRRRALPGAGFAPRVADMASAAPWIIRLRRLARQASHRQRAPRSTTSKSSFVRAHNARPPANRMRGDQHGNAPGTGDLSQVACPAGRSRFGVMRSATAHRMTRRRTTPRPAGSRLSPPCTAGGCVQPVCNPNGRNAPARVATAPAPILENWLLRGTPQHAVRSSSAVGWWLPDRSTRLSVGGHLSLPAGGQGLP